MEVWHYSGMDRLHALTNDASGANLPEHLGPWLLQAIVLLDEYVEDESQAISLIHAHGFCCFR